MPILRGSSSDDKTHINLRLASTLINIKIIRTLVKSYMIPRNKIFVNASVDTLFQSCLASGGKVRAGYNVFPSGYSLLYRAMDYIAARHTIDRILAHTQFQRKLYQKIGIEQNKISIIPHCIDTERIALMASGDVSKLEIDKPIIFYAGRLYKAKGICELVSSFQNLAQRISSTLVIVGDGPLKEWIFQKGIEIERKYHSSNILFLQGWRPPQEFLKYMLRSDVVVLPSYSEMCPIVLLEAMALGRAVVSTDVGGIPELIQDGFNGLLVRPRDENELEQALLKLISEPGLRQKLGHNAFQTILRNHDVSVLAPKFLQFMEENN
ncbi:MAG: glycosyltransferase family 4 protein [Candidatus Bathyarchaeia archaeon]